MRTQTDKQIRATGRNWCKKMISGAAYSLKSAANVPNLSVGLTQFEIQKLNEISNELFKLLSNWRRKL